MTRRTTTLVCAAGLMVVLLSVAFLLPVPYVTLRPGPTFDTLGNYEGKPVIAISGDVKTYEPTGSLRLTTVSVTRADSRISLAEAFAAYLDPSEAVVPRDLVYPPTETPEQAKQQTTAQMSGSKLTSSAAAARAAGYPVRTVQQVTAVTDGGPADGVLESRDQITSVDGTRVRTAAQTADQIGGTDPGSRLRLGIVRDGDASTVELTTAADDKDPSRSRIGITVGSDIRLPFTVQNNLGSQIGGPSAGTMFALAIYDELTPGALTGGRDVAGTGEIEANGTIDPIGGIHQKIVGAADSGVTVFLVPADNCSEAVASGDEGLRLVKVDRLDDAISSLESLADDPAAEVPSCS